MSTSPDGIRTILHDDSLMAEMMSKDKYTNYRKMFFKARFNNSVRGEVESLWPERWTVEEFNSLGLVFSYQLPSNDKEIIENMKTLREIGGLSLQTIQKRKH